jgi:hypothetical protein
MTKKQTITMNDEERTNEGIAERLWQEEVAAGCF